MLDTHPPTHRRRLNSEIEIGYGEEDSRVEEMLTHMSNPEHRWRNMWPRRYQRVVQWHLIKVLISSALGAMFLSLRHRGIYCVATLWDEMEGAKDGEVH